MTAQPVFLALPELGSVRVGRKNQNAGSFARVVAISEDGEWIFSQLARSSNWSHVSSFLSTYRLTTANDPPCPLPPWSGKVRPLKNGQRFTELAPERPHGPAKCNVPAENDATSASASEPEPVVAPPPPVVTEAANHPEATGPVVESFAFCGESLMVVVVDGVRWVVANHLCKALGLHFSSVYTVMDKLPAELATFADIPGRHPGSVTPARVVALSHFPKFLADLGSRRIRSDVPAKLAQWVAEARRVLSASEPVAEASHPAASSEANEANESADASVPDGMALVRVEGVSLAVSLAHREEDALVRDITLGERLGFARPSKIRELIRRHVEAGNLHGLLSLPTVGNGSANAGTLGYWLNEEQTLFIIAKSETPVANELTRQMIRVFMAWRRGQVAPAPAPAFDVREIVSTAVAETVRAVVPAVMTAMREVMTPPAPAVSPEDAETLRKAKEQKANATAKGQATREFNDLYPDIRAQYLPLLRTFLGQRALRLDANKTDAVATWAFAGDLKDQFGTWLRSLTPAHLSPPERATYRMLDEVSGNISVKVGKEDPDNMGRKRLPWAFRSGGTGGVTPPSPVPPVDPRQTHIPFDGRGQK